MHRGYSAALSIANRRMACFEVDPDPNNHWPSQGRGLACNVLSESPSHLSLFSIFCSPWLPSSSCDHGLLFGHHVGCRRGFAHAIHGRKSTSAWEFPAGLAPFPQNTFSATTQHKDRPADCAHWVPVPGTRFREHFHMVFCQLSAQCVVLQEDGSV